MVRKIIAVILAYATYVLLALAFFKVSGQNPHGDTSTNFKLLTAVFGIFSALISGVVLQVVANATHLTLNYILAIIIAAFATFSLLKAEGSHWTQLLAIFLFAPASIIGGLCALRTRKKLH